MNNQFKLITVGLLIGVGHLLSSLMIPLGQKFLTIEDMANIGIFESSLFIVITLISFGLTNTTTRDVAIEVDWKNKLLNVKDARLAFSISLALTGCLGLTVFGNIFVWLPLIISPFIALNLDFALYGRDKPVTAAFASFIRLTSPLIVFFCMMNHMKVDPTSYMTLISIAMVASTIFVAKKLDVSLISSPKLNSVLLYKGVFLIGISGLLLNFQRIGLVSIYGSFLSAKEVMVLFATCKYYLIFIALRRFFIQTLYKKLLDGNTFKHIESFFLIAGFVNLLIAFLFSKEIATFIFNDNDYYYQKTVYVFSLLILSGSFFATADARLMLLKGDKHYIKSTLIPCVLFIIVSIPILHFYRNPHYIIGALAMSELLIAFSYQVSLKKISYIGTLSNANYSS